MTGDLAALNDYYIGDVLHDDRVGLAGEWPVTYKTYEEVEYC